MKKTDLLALKTNDFVEIKHEVVDSKLLPRTSPEEIELYISQNKFDVKKEPDPASGILFHGDKIIGSRGNIISVTGRAKSRKTVVASSLMTALFQEPGSSYFGFRAEIGREEKVIHIDTEQGDYHYYHSVRRVFNDAQLSAIPENFLSVLASDAEVPFMWDMLDYIIEKHSPSVIILDGITDFVIDINDNKECDKVKRKLKRYAKQKKVLFIVIIHTTKTTGYATGVLGTMLEKIVETMIKVEIDEGGGDPKKADRNVSHISCQYSRNAPFNTFSIRYSELIKGYEVVPETEIQTKGANGNKDPYNYEDDVHQKIITRTFGFESAIPPDRFKGCLSKAFSEITGDKINFILVNKYINYYNEKMWIMADPDRQWMRVNAIAQNDDNEEDKLPF